MTPHESPSPEEIRFFLENKAIFKAKRFMALIRSEAEAYDFKRKFYGFDQALYEVYRQKFMGEYARIKEFPFLEITEGDKFKLITERKPYDGSFDQAKYKSFAQSVKKKLAAEIR